MTSGSLGLRSSSYGSLLQHQQQSQNGGVFLQQKPNSTPPIASRKTSKMFVNKDKENMFMWIFKSVHRKKVGMLFLCLVSIAAMLWVFYVGKGLISSINFYLNSSNFSFDFLKSILIFYSSTRRL